MPSERIYVFQHVACENLGTFAAVLARRGYRPEYIRFFAGDSIPSDWSAAAALIVLGGPMSVNDAPRLAYLGQEKTMLREALARSKPVLGICLGAQLLAAAAGSSVFAAARPEIGWGAVSLTVDGRQDPLLGALATVGSVFHWHGETFDLPPGSVRLAFSALTMNQAVRIGPNAYGLQFHLEVDAPMIQEWVREYPQDLGADASSITDRMAAETVQHVGALRSAAVAVLDRFLDLVAAAAGS
ncbi:MAG: gamma-glutamyl-gamma-aminobutyrate hydrolase family protein [Deltaproteobacteria bacterium]|nr:gamma-glutamyl-gamma-aminobutyrate hydrolase family protein [Deltaproteobacteria bacterium]